jgi:hypothetical protein
VNNAVVSTGDGYGVLVENNYHNNQQSPVHGSWLYEYATNGEVRKTHLRPAEEYLQSNFQFFAANERDSAFLYGRGRSSYVVRLNEDRKVAAYGKALIAQQTTPAGMVVDKDSAWLLGTGKTDDGLHHVWLERIEF